MRSIGQVPSRASIGDCNVRTWSVVEPTRRRVLEICGLWEILLVVYRSFQLFLRGFVLLWRRNIFKRIIYVDDERSLMIHILIENKFNFVFLKCFILYFSNLINFELFLYCALISAKCVQLWLDNEDKDECLNVRINVTIKVRVIL